MFIRLKDVAYPVMNLIDALSIDTIELTHALGEVTVGGFYKQDGSY